MCSWRVVSFLVIAVVALLVPRAVEAQCLATHGSIVAIGCEDLAISRDDGATFTHTGLHVVAVTVTDDERVFVANHAEPPSLFEVGAGHVALPLTEVAALASVGRSVVVVGSRAPADPEEVTRTVVLVRGPDGTVRELGSLGVWSSATRVSATGTERAPRVEIVMAFGLSCWGTVQVRRAIVDARGAQIADLSNDMECAYHGEACGGFFDVEIGAHGTAYAVRAPSDEGTERPGPLLLVRPTERTTPTTLHVPSGATLSIAHNGQLTLALLDGVLHRLEGTRATSLGGQIDRNARLAHVDDRGRPYAETAQGLVRFSRGAGWSPIRP